MAARLKRWPRLCLVVLSCFASTAIAAQTDQFRTVAPNGLTRLTTTIDSAPVAISIFTREKAGTADNSNARTACTGGRIPCSLVERLTVSVSGREVFVPLSSVITLADVNRAKIDRGADGSFVLVLECGDAADAYSANIRFNGERVLERDVIGGESGVTEERTVYQDTSHAFAD